MDDAFYYNALAHEENGDYKKLKKLSDPCAGDWKCAYQKYKQDNPLLSDPWKKWKDLGRSDMRLVLYGAPEYPPLLKEIAHPPFGIYVRGDLSERTKKNPVAIVGTRKATNEGKTTARRFAGELAEHGCAIISGLAFGIDAAAHAGCLDAGGATIAVLASGTDVISPRTNAHLAEKILENGGAIISEYPPGSEALPHRFLERNRIISGLSKGVLVIEAPESSGALATVRFATEQNRDVFVVPGPIAHPNFVGSHHLIRNGAELVAQPEHIMETYGIIHEKFSPEKEGSFSFEETLILNVLRECSAEADVDKIMALTKLEPRTANQVLSFLLIKEIIEETGSGYKINGKS